MNLFQTRSIKAFSAAALLGATLVLPGRANAADSNEMAPVVNSLDANGLAIGFRAGGNNVRSFQIGTATVTATLQENGMVGIQVTKGSVTLAAPDDQPLVVLTQGDVIEISGFLDTAAMFDVLSTNDTQMLRLSAIAAMTIHNLGPRALFMKADGHPVIVGGVSGQANAVVGHIYQGVLPQNALASLKKGRTVIGEDDNHQAIAITRDLHGNVSRKSLDAGVYDLEKTRAGSLLDDARRLKPVVGAPAKFKVGETEVEITGTKTGATLTVTGGKPLTLATANAQYIGELPVGAKIELSDLTIADGDFYAPAKSSVLFIPVTVAYTITNLGNNSLTLGRTGEQVALKKGEMTHGTRSGYVATSIDSTQIAALPSGTAVEFSDGGDHMLMIVGDPLDHQKKNVAKATFINISNHLLTWKITGLGTMLTAVGSGVTAPTDGLKFYDGTFDLETPPGNLMNISGFGDFSALITNGGILTVVQGGVAFQVAIPAMGKTMSPAEINFMSDYLSQTLGSTLIAINSDYQQTQTGRTLNGASTASLMQSSFSDDFKELGGTGITVSFLTVDTSKVESGTYENPSK
ncbi:MAG: hypothetical protein ACREJ2_11865 [Planctomycetota bacterium]